MKNKDFKQLFAPTNSPLTKQNQVQKWKVLIVDDVEDIHTVIRLALGGFFYKKKSIEFIDAYSGTEAKKMLQENPDISLILLDVVMETDNAGLELVKYIRETIQNQFIQIVLWTGQPGKAPKKEVIISYDINDYKTKTELNDDNIFTVVLASLRTFDAITTVESYRQNLEEKVKDRTKEVVQQKKKITDSIKYALHIQNALLPSHKSIEKLTKDYFIYYKPKDIVSGDFYWCTENNDKLYFAAADCTGHGVPGAFMSMIGNTLLNEIIQEHKLSKPSQILKKLNECVKYMLNQGGAKNEANEDGMDITLCCYDKNKRNLTVACANHTAFFIQNNIFSTIEGDPFSIGGIFAVKPNQEFTDHSFSLNDPCKIYMFSDGYKDQFGGEKTRKFSSKRFLDLISSMYKKEFKKQYELIDKTFNNWKGNYKQIDDVMVIGLKII